MKKECEKYHFEKKIDLPNSYRFEKVIKENFREALVQNVLNLEHNIDDDSRSLTIVLG